MEAKAKLFGHAIHPMLIVFPLGLLATSIVFDIIHLATGNGRWADVSFWMIAAGIIGGLAAAVFGLIDYLAIPGGTRAKAVGLWHGLGNVIVLLLFAVSWFMRRDNLAIPGTGAVVMSGLGLALAVITGWLGGELVDRLGVGVDDGAHLNSPSSLSGRSAREVATPGETAFPTPARRPGGRTAEGAERTRGEPGGRTAEELSTPTPIATRPTDRDSPS